MSPLSIQFADLAGWLPAIIFPGATLIQLRRILKKKDATSVSTTTWTLFGVANIGLYLYAEKYASFQSIFGFLGTAALDFTIVAVVLKLRRHQQV